MKTVIDAEFTVLTEEPKRKIDRGLVTTISLDINGVGIHRGAYDSPKFAARLCKVCGLTLGQRPKRWLAERFEPFGIVLFLLFENAYAVYLTRPERRFAILDIICSFPVPDEFGQKLGEVLQRLFRAESVDYDVLRRGERQWPGTTT